MAEPIDKDEEASEIASWETLEEKSVFACRIFDLVSRRLRHPSRGSEDDFYILKTSNWVNVIPVTPDYEVVLVRQYRFGIEDLSWEIPGGIMDAGEDPVEAGLRELREETGFVAQGSELLGNVAANPAIMDNRCHFVWAKSVRLETQTEWDEHEELEVGVFPLEEVYAMVHRGEIVHSLVVAALMRFYPHWEKIRTRLR